MTALEKLRALYFKATQATIQDDFVAAIDLFKEMTEEADRDKAAVFMEGIAEMRREWAGGRPEGGGKKSAAQKAAGKKPAPKRPGVKR